MIARLRRGLGYVLLAATMLAGMLCGVKITKAQWTRAACYMILMALAAGVLAALCLYSR